MRAEKIYRSYDLAKKTSVLLGTPACTFIELDLLMDRILKLAKNNAIGGVYKTRTLN